MPRNSAGIYTLPDPPVVPDEIIESVDENVTRNDMAAEITNSLDRNGRGGMLAPFRVADGSIGAPGLAFTNSTGSGLWRIGPDNWALVAGGVNIAEVSPAGFVIHVGVTGPVAPGEFSDVSVSGNLTVAGTSTFTGRIFANGGITLGGTLTGLTSLSLTTLAVTGTTTLGAVTATSAAISGGLNVSGGATINGPVTVGSINASPALLFTIGSAERARITSSGYFKASDNGAYFSVSATYHELVQHISDYIAGFGNTNGNPGGVVFAYTAAPNSSVQFNSFVQCVDSAASVLRADIMSNGGIRAYMANNVTLSDVTEKFDVRPLTTEEIADLWDAHRDVGWCAFKFADQAHDDPNIGYTAQEIEAHFAGIAPWLVEEMEITQGRRKFVYEHDLQNIAHALLSECQRRIEALETLNAPQLR